MAGCQRVLEGTGARGDRGPLQAGGPIVVTKGFRPLDQRAERGVSWSGDFIVEELITHLNPPNLWTPLGPSTAEPKVQGGTDEEPEVRPWNEDYPWSGDR
jgi:hypothetical protein